MDEIDELIRRYRNVGIIVDTNLLILWMIGNFDRSYISKFKRTQQYNQDDFVILQTVIEQFVRVITTPFILAEVNSLSNQLMQSLKSSYFAVFAEQVAAFQEVYQPSATLVQKSELLTFGLTDTCILSAAQGHYLVLTDDLRLALHLSTRKVDVVNFVYLRTYLL